MPELIASVREEEMQKAKRDLSARRQFQDINGFVHAAMDNRRKRN